MVEGDLRPTEVAIPALFLAGRVEKILNECKSVDVLCGTSSSLHSETCKVCETVHCTLKPVPPFRHKCRSASKKGEVRLLVFRLTLHPNSNLNLRTQAFISSKTQGPKPKTPNSQLQNPDRPKSLETTRPGCGSTGDARRSAGGAAPCTAAGPGRGES